MTLTFGTLFSGIGGGDLGFERAGMIPRWMVEIEPTCQRILRRHWPGVPIHADVRQVGAHNLTPVDVIIFGSPCQDLSVAGKRAGLEGERSGLFFEAVRVIEEVRPRIAIWENVPGAFSSHQGDDFAAVLDTLADAGALGLGWRVLDAQWFGVPQRRRRIFLVSDFGAGSLAEVLVESEGVPGDPAPRRETRPDLAGTLGSGAPGRGWASDIERMTFVPVDPVAPLTAQGLGKAGPDVKQAQAGHLIPYTVHGEHSTAMTGNGDAAVAFETERTRSLDTTGGYANNQGGTVIAFTSKDDGRDAADDISPTLRSMNFDKSHLNGGGQIAVAFGGNNTKGPIDVATCLNAHGGTGRMDFESETFIVEEPAVYQCQGSNVGPLGALRTGDAGVTSGVPFTFYHNSGLEQKVQEDLSPPLTVGGRNVGSVAVCVTGEVTHALRSEGADASEDGTGRGTPIITTHRSSGRGWWDEDEVAQGLRASTGAGVHESTLVARTVALRGREGGTTAELGDEIATALRASQGGGDKPHVLVEAVAIAENQRGEVRTSEIHPQLTTGGGKPGQGYPAIAFTERGRPEGRTVECQEELAYALLNPAKGGRSQERNVAYAGGVRRLTPRECERLQGFPDDWTAWGIDERGKLVTISDSARYRALGNAMAVPVLAWIARRIVDAMEAA